MNTSEVCARCLRATPRRLLRQRCAPRRSYTANFVSLSAPKTIVDDLNGNGDQKFLSRRGQDGRAIKPAIKTRPRQHRTTRGTLLEDLFEQSVQKSSHQMSDKRADSISGEIYANLDILSNMLQDEELLMGETWDFFISRLGPHVWKSEASPVSRPVLFPALAHALFNKVLAAKRQSPLDRSLPTATHITLVYCELGLIRIRGICRVLGQLLKTLNSALSKDDRQHVVEDLLGTWRRVYDYQTRSETAKFLENEDLSDWSFLPKLDQNFLRRSRNSDGVEDLFRHLIPSPPSSSRLLASLATITFALVANDHPASSSTSAVHKNPFVSSIADLLSVAGIRAFDINRLLHSESSLQDFVNIDVKDILKRASQISLMSDELDSSRKDHFDLYQSTDRKTIYRRLVTARRAKDLAALNNLWNDVSLAAAQQRDLSASELLPNKSPDLKLQHWESTTILTENLCNQFILAFMTAGQPDRSIHVWNTMIEHSITPSVLTWNAMLEGCAIAKDWVALETVWARCLASGQAPDIQLWTTRINGLMTSNKINHALRALWQMGSRWEETAKKHKIQNLRWAGDIDEVVKPSISCINAVVSGLLYHGKQERAQKILDWGDHLGIKPDIYTYNILLRSFVRDHRHGNTKALLQQMQDEGIKPDVATFTTLLDEIFSSDADYSLETQSEIVDAVFREMETAGVKANEWTYSKIIHSLLHGKQTNSVAVKSVLERMVAQGLRPSPALYTALADWYFQQGATNQVAITRLLENAKSSEKNMDHIFWNRIIHGYSAAGDTVNALKYLREVGQDASWSAREAVLVALVQNNELTIARELIENTRMEMAGPPIPEEHSTEGQRLFWATVWDLKLGDGQPSEDLA